MPSLRLLANVQTFAYNRHDTSANRHDVRHSATWKGRMETQQKFGSRAADLAVANFIRRLAGAPGTPRQIARTARDHFAGTGKLIPSEKTIERMVNEVRSSPAREPTGLAAWPVRGPGLRATLESYAEAIEVADWTVRLTSDECEWVAIIASAAPDLPPYQRYVIARRYLARASAGQDTDDLDPFLAFAPWRDARCHERYRRAVDRGLIVEAPSGIQYTFTAAFQADPDRRHAVLLVDESTDRDEYGKHLLQYMRRSMDRWDERHASGQNVDDGGEGHE